MWQGEPGDPAIRNAWGQALNENDVLLEAGILGTVGVSIAGLGNYALTTANGAADQARPYVQSYTGALTGSCTVTLPNVPKFGQAINATTGGFSVILTSGGGTKVVIPPESLPYSYYCDGAGNVIIWQAQPGPLFGDFKFSGLAAEGGGWRMCYGQARPRTDPLWQWITAQGIAWAFGNGDGATTYTMPDMRGQALFGIDNMGGVAANRVTAAVSGIVGTTNGAAGGNQATQAHTHAVTLAVTDSGHVHPITDLPHLHNVPDPGHAHVDFGHGHADGGHGHADSGHVHGYIQPPAGSGTGPYGGSTNAPQINANTDTGFANIQTGFANIGVGHANIESSFTGISNTSSVDTGITGTQTGFANLTGGGTAASYGTGTSQNMPPTMMSTCLLYTGA